MKHCSLVRFLDGDLPQLLFAAEIASEVSECTNALKSTGNGSIFITDGPDSVLTRDRCRRLLHAVADKVLSPEAASYVADCIIMGHAFDWEDDAVGLAIQFLADGDTRPRPEEDVRAHILKLG